MISNDQIKAFELDQIRKGNALNTAYTQSRNATHFLDWLTLHHSTIETLDYNTAIQYVDYLKQQGNALTTIRFKLKSLFHFHNYLKDTAVIERSQNNVFALIQLKGGVRKIPNNLFTSDELQEIYHAQRTKGLAGKRDKVLLSLVVFQGVGSLELSRIELKDIDLNEGKIYVPAIQTRNSRVIELKPIQVLLFQDYIANIRPVIAQHSGAQTEQLLLNVKAGKQTLNNVIHYLLKNLKPQFPKLTGLDQIRKSVITNWVHMHGLRQAQYFAGHKFVSSTERYNEDKHEGLRNELKIFHPL